MPLEAGVGELVRLQAWPIHPIRKVPTGSPCVVTVTLDTSDLPSFAPEHTSGRPGEDSYGHVTRFDRNLMRMQITCDTAGGVDELFQWSRIEDLCKKEATMVRQSNCAEQANPWHI